MPFDFCSFLLKERESKAHTLRRPHHNLNNNREQGRVEIPQLGLRIGLQVHNPSMQTMNGGGGSAKALERHSEYTS
jgi:hypothetical protein